MNSRLAKKLNCKLDIYKVAHHGCGSPGNDDTLEIYKPDCAVITNYETNVTESVNKLKNANPDTNIYITGNGGKVFDIFPKGNIEVTDLSGY